MVELDFTAAAMRHFTEEQDKVTDLKEDFFLEILGSRTTVELGFMLLD